MMRMRFATAAVSILCLGTVLQGAEPPSWQDTALQVDRSLVGELGLEGQMPPSGDATFFRRIYLDLVGQVPDSEAVRAFANDRDSGKRARAVESLLARNDFGENWARYWRDVIMYRRSEPRAQVASPALQKFLAQQFNDDVGWDETARAFITATGDVRENGATALIMAQSGKPEDVVAEISRIFLGIQIQCAQCHDHPTDRWKREQFHQLAAFFPRVAVRPKRDGEKRSFVVAANDRNRRRRNKNNNNRVVGTPEHYMPDLDDPSSQGAKTKPVFFVTGETVPFGTADAVRRGSLADWITSPENGWFAKAFVNRVWSELAGEGLVQPVDDMGPDRESIAPDTLELLASAFAANHYDVKWLFRAITATETYQQDSRSRRDYDETPFQSNCPQRLRGDQLYDAVIQTLGVPDRKPRQNRGGYGIGFGPRTAFNQAFGFDPSEPREEVQGSMQQALFLMNSPLINRAINARRNSELAKLLRKHSDNREAVTELYLQTLSREPTGAELRTCLSYIRRVQKRAEAFEDLQWALINSTEFLHRR